MVGMMIPGVIVHRTIIIAQTSSVMTSGGHLGPHTTVTCPRIHTLTGTIGDLLVVLHQNRHPSPVLTMCTVYHVAHLHHLSRTEGGAMIFIPKGHPAIMESILMILMVCILTRLGATVIYIPMLDLALARQCHPHSLLFRVDPI